MQVLTQEQVNAVAGQAIHEVVTTSWSQSSTWEEPGTFDFFTGTQEYYIVTMSSWEVSGYYYDDETGISEPFIRGDSTYDRQLMYR